MTPTQSELAEAASARPWPAERIELWPIERLIPYANNARLHSEADLDKLAAAIRNGAGLIPYWSTRRVICWPGTGVSLQLQERWRRQSR